MAQNTDRNRSKDIQNRMLLHKYRGNADQKCGDDETGLPWLRQLFAPQSCLHHCQRANHMNRRADIGIGIELIESSDKAGQEIIPLKRSCFSRYSHMSWGIIIRRSRDRRLGMVRILYFFISFPHFRKNSTPRQLGPQWQEMVLPATVSITSSKGRNSFTNAVTLSTISLGTPECVTKIRS